MHKRLHVDLLAAARVAGTTGLSLCWVLLVGRWTWATRTGWQRDVALPAWQSGGRDVVAVWARAGLEEDCWRAEGKVGVDAEVYHGRDEAV